MSVARTVVASEVAGAAHSAGVGRAAVAASDTAVVVEDGRNTARSRRAAAYLGA